MILINMLQKLLLQECYLLQRKFSQLVKFQLKCFCLFACPNMKLIKTELDLNFKTSKKKKKIIVRSGYKFSYFTTPQTLL